MKHYLFLFSCLFLVFCSCEKDEMDELQKEETKTDGTSYTFTSKEVKNVKNFQGFLSKKESNDPHETVEGYHKFSFNKGGEVAEDSNEWDIAFNKTTIIVNGGKRVQGEPKRTGKGACYMVEGLFDDIKSVEFDKLKQESVPKWYTYNTNGNHIVRVIPGRVIVIRTHDEKYAKMVIKSYYKDNDTEKAPRYYNFDYIYQ